MCFLCFLNAAVDCTWKEWGEWSACPDKCEVSKVFRARGINEHKCGGNSCTGPSEEEKVCDRFAEVKMEKDLCKQSLANITKENKRLNEKLCQNVLCYNEGTCQEGECICVDGFGGSDCAGKIHKDNMNTGKCQQKFAFLHMTHQD